MVTFYKIIAIRIMGRQGIILITQDPVPYSAIALKTTITIIL